MGASIVTVTLDEHYRVIRESDLPSFIANFPTSDDLLRDPVARMLP